MLHYITGAGATKTTETTGFSLVDEWGKCENVVGARSKNLPLRFEKLGRFTSRDDFNLRTKGWVGASAVSQVGKNMD